MRLRRRQTIPPFFNLSLLDVVCNALGAVIFLMFLNYWQANHVSQHLQASLNQLHARESELDATRKQLEQLLAHLQATQQRLGQTQEYLKRTEASLSETEKARQQVAQEAAELRLLLQAERAVRQNLQQELSALRRQVQDLLSLAQAASMQLQQRERQLEELAADLRSTVNERDALARQLHQTQADAAAQSKLLAQVRVALARHQVLVAEGQHALQVRNAELATLQARLHQLEMDQAKSSARAHQLEKQLDEAAVRQKDLAQQLAELQKLADSLARERDDLARRLEIQRQENSRLSDQLVLAQHQVGAERQMRGKLLAELQEARKRFAGVELSGQRVLFLVDTSGSMGKRDPQTDDPQKWKRVCETVRHVMLSMPNLQQFQVITFASEVGYPLGAPGQWLEFDQDRSPIEVHTRLSQLKPQGGTNLHLAFEEAFGKYRNMGLDTIFLFSDGLPTESPDLTVEELRLGNQERERLLAPRLLERIVQWNQPSGNASQRVRIHAIGFYYDSPNLGNFLWSLAIQNDGSFVGMSQR